MYLPNIEIDSTQLNEGEKREKERKWAKTPDFLTVIFHRYIWSCFAWFDTCRNCQWWASCSVLGSLRRAAAVVTLTGPVVALRAGEERVSSFELSWKTTDYFSLVCFYNGVCFHGAGQAVMQVCRESKHLCASPPACAAPGSVLRSQVPTQRKELGWHSHSAQALQMPELYTLEVSDLFLFCS